MTVLEFIQTLDKDTCMKCTFKVFGKSTHFFYFVLDDTEEFNWDKVTREDLDKWYKRGIKWLKDEGPADYIIEQIEVIDENPDAFIKYRFILRCKADAK